MKVISNLWSDIKSNGTRKALLVTFFLLLLVEFPLFIIFTNQYSQSLDDELEVSIERTLNSRGTSLSIAIAQRFSLIEAVDAYVSTNKTESFLNQTFIPYVSDLYKSYEGIRNIAIAPGGVQTYVYPIEGNEQTIGHNLLTDNRTQVQEDIQRMLSTKNVTLSGPYELRQGGVGLVIRKPIYYQNGTFWGIISMVADMAPIYEKAELEPRTERFIFAMRNWRNIVFFGEPDVFDQDPISVNVTLPEYEWELAGVPTNPLIDGIRQEKRIFQIIISLVFISIAFLTYLLINRQERLEYKVAKKTKEHIELKQQLHKQEKLESLGLIAGGIAHDFNNSLTSILGNVTLLKAELDEDAKAISFLDDIETQVQMTSERIKQLLAFTGKNKYNTRVFDIVELIEDMKNIIQISVPDTTEIRYWMPNDRLLLDGDPGQIRQAIMNLVINASDALNNKPGKVRFRVEQVDLDDISKHHKLTPGEYIKIQVIDTGEGIREEDMSQIFDPFFSTKEVGRGMGLASVYGIISSHGGDILVESEENVGTTFEVYLPTDVDLEYEPLNSPKSEDKKIIEKAGKVLICDDEEKIINILERGITEWGFDVITASNGYQALHHITENDDLSLIILDLVLPGLDGETVIEQIPEEKRYIPIIVISGYSPKDNEIIDAAEGIYFLGKPFSLDDLRNIIADIDL